MGYAKKNAAGTLPENNTSNRKADDRKAVVNTIQRTAYVARLAVDKTDRNFRKYRKYDADNLYPQKAKSTAERSQTVTTAAGTLASFLAGQGFGGDLNKIKVNNEGQTLWDLLYYSTNEYAIFKGYALHFNYNVFGEIIEINEINFECLRWDNDLTKLLYCPDWTNPRDADIIEYDTFNPEKVQEQSSEKGIEKYNGQVLYQIPRRKDIYTTCRFDSVFESAQFEYESAVYSLSSIQNDFAFGYLLKYPFHADSEEENREVRERLQQGTGAANANKSIMLKIKDPDGAILRSKLVEPISRNNIDNLFSNQNERAEHKIYACYQQPPILNGVASNGMFNQDQFKDAFDYYNSYTETERDSIEKVWTFILQNSIFVGEDTELEIIQKSYITKEDGGNSPDNSGGRQELPANQPTVD